MGRFTRFPLVKCDGLGVFPNADQAEAKIGLTSQLLEIERDEGLAKDTKGDKRAQDGIETKEQDQRL